jgi:hypothetical protein
VPETDDVANEIQKASNNTGFGTLRMAIQATFAIPKPIVTARFKAVNP